MSKTKIFFIVFILASLCNSMFKIIAKQYDWSHSVATLIIYFIIPVGLIGLVGFIIKLIKKKKA